MDKIIQFFKELQTDKKFKNFDEASIKQAIILKILSLLGWDPFDVNEIQPEYNVNKQKIDYALKQKDSLQVFVVVKKGLDNFKTHIEMLMDSSGKSDVKIAVYTNGFSWWFFLPSAEGSIDDKRFWAVDIGKEKAELIAKRLNDFLSKENITDGSAVNLAEEICNKRKEVMLINEHLPKAWEKVINEPEKYLIDIISEVTKELCGYKPKREKVVEFIKAEGKIKSKQEENLVIDDLTKIIDDTPKNGFKGKAIKSFIFGSKEHSVKSWEDLPWELCNCILKTHKDSFENVLYIILKGRDFFSKDPHQFIMNKQIAGTGIYINTDISEVVALALCNEILKVFGYEESDLIINAK
ncbi:MAG: hypothetical protein JXL81_14385 [Deltaproteobacteria bacterium]|nr:hypothetical protein [Deltaproteobacteria bacterium]